MMGGLLCLLLGSAIPYFQQIRLRPLTWTSHRIATYSYGIYLGHSFFIWYALTVHNDWLLFWLMWLTIPTILYHTFEHPMVQLGRGVATWVLKPASLQAAVKHVRRPSLGETSLPPEASGG